MRLVCCTMASYSNWDLGRHLFSCSSAIRVRENCCRNAMVLFHSPTKVDGDLCRWRLMSEVLGLVLNHASFLVEVKGGGAMSCPCRGSSVPSAEVGTRSVENAEGRKRSNVIRTASVADQIWRWLDRVQQTSSTGPCSINPWRYVIWKPERHRAAM
jgi:hypothetical protein